MRLTFPSLQTQRRNKSIKAETFVSCYTKLRTRRELVVKASYFRRVLSWDLGCYSGEGTQRVGRKRRSDPTSPLHLLLEQCRSNSPPVLQPTAYFLLCLPAAALHSQDLVPPPPSLIPPLSGYREWHCLNGLNVNSLSSSNGSTDSPSRQEAMNSRVSATWQSSRTARHNHRCQECPPSPGTPHLVETKPQFVYYLKKKNTHNRHTQLHTHTHSACKDKKF